MKKLSFYGLRKDFNEKESPVDLIVMIQSDPAYPNLVPNVFIGHTIDHIFDKIVDFYDCKDDPEEMDKILKIRNEVKMREEKEGFHPEFSCNLFGLKWFFTEKKL